MRVEGRGTKEFARKGSRRPILFNDSLRILCVLGVSAVESVFKFKDDANNFDPFNVRRLGGGICLKDDANIFDPYGRFPCL